MISTFNDQTSIETYLSIDKSKPQEMVSTDEEDESEPQEMVVSTDEEDELTPRPKKKESRDQSLPIDNDLEDEPFETPLVLRHHKKRHPRVVVDSDDKAEPTKMPFKRKREVEEKTRVRGDGTEVNRNVIVDRCADSVPIRDR